MALRLVQVNFKARDDSVLGRFWADALGWDLSSEGPGVTNVEPSGLVLPDPSAVCVDVVAVPDPETVKYRAHLDLASSSLAHQTELVARLKTLGATSADIGQGDMPWTVFGRLGGKRVLRARASSDLRGHRTDRRSGCQLYRSPVDGPVLERGNGLDPA